jgi:hypothetical protein
MEDAITEKRIRNINKVLRMPEHELDDLLRARGPTLSKEAPSGLS